MASAAPKRQHFSASQLDMYCRCPEAYRRRYLEKDVIPPSAGQARGKGMHVGAAENMRQKLQSGRDLKPAEIIEIGMNAFDIETKGGFTLNAEEASRGFAVVVSDAAHDLREILDVHARQQAPDYLPTLVEEPVRIELPNAPRDLLGVLDLATTENEVVDFKTAKRSKSQADVDSSVQLTIYAACHQVATGRPAAFVSLDTVVQLAKSTKRQKLTGTRDAHDFNALANRINAVQHAIDAGSFPPAAPGSWNCSDRWCGFHSTCPFVNSRRGSQGD